MRVSVGECRHMVKRIASALLWFMAGSYGWAVIAYAVNAPSVWAPVVGTILAVMIAGDPLHRIWRATTSIEPIGDGSIENASGTFGETVAQQMS